MSVEVPFFSLPFRPDVTSEEDAAETNPSDRQQHTLVSPQGASVNRGVTIKHSVVRWKNKGVGI